MTDWGLIDFGAAAGAFLAVIALAAWVVKSLQKISNPLRDIKLATIISLRYSIVRAHREYTQDKQISRIALECVCAMYERYKALGGNGFVDTLIDEVKHLPVDHDSWKL